MTDLSNELATKRAAILKARNSTKPAVPSEQVLAILKTDLARVQVPSLNKSSMNFRCQTHKASCLRKTSLRTLIS